MLSRFSVFMATCLLIIAGMLAVSCSDDDNPVAATKHWARASLGTGIDSNGHVLALAVYDKKLIAGGYFDTAGGVSVNYIANWGGSSWTSLGTGMNDPVFALIVYDNKLIAAGNFTVAGGVSATRIAAWGYRCRSSNSSPPVLHV